jgi:centromeric protein E
MRPLNTNEGSYRRVWKVLPKYNSVTQTTADGKPLAEKVTGRTFFTFDKTFGEDSDTPAVYQSVAKGIVDSAVSGLNGTIFAYGQTSSGKTFTMQGSGTIEQGSAGQAGGIVHMAATDIFKHIEANPDRIFHVRASFLEIYNEDVRDLLSPDQKVLQIREDPRRGVFVQSQEEAVSDYASLLQVLFTGEKSRTFACTAMNERSSRSHTIFRVTIESRAKEVEKPAAGQEDDENRPDGAVRVSTLNLVDLAGSESVRHTGATGDRQKEGGMINQSLLYLSRVIVALGTPNQTHINFRDSKLTRILQPSLSGNARMAIICCATPSELYLEETRSTLAFASRAKLVKTNAKVNEVLDDRSVIRRLQKDLAKARAQAGGVPSDQIKALEQEAATAGSAARQAEEKLRKLQASMILNAHSDLLFQPQESIQDAMSTALVPRKRRRSDGAIRLSSTMSPQSAPTERPASPQTLPRPEKKTRVLQDRKLPNRAELALLREALQSKSRKVHIIQKEMDAINRRVKAKESEFVALSCRNDILESEREQSHTKVSSLNEGLQQLRHELSQAHEAREGLLAEKEKAVSELLARLEDELGDRKVLEETVDALQEGKGRLEAAQQVLHTQQTELQQKIDQLEESGVRSMSELAQAAEEKQHLQEQYGKEHEESQHRESHLAAELEVSRQEHTDTMQQLTTIQQELLEERSQHQSTKVILAEETDKSQKAEVHLSVVEEEGQSLALRLSHAKEEADVLTQALESHEATSRQRNEQLITVHAMTLVRYQRLQESLNKIEQERTSESNEHNVRIESTLAELENTESLLQASNTNALMLEGRLSSLNLEKEDLLSQVAGLEEVRETTGSQMVSLRNELDETHANLTCRDEQMASIQGKNASLQSKVEEVELAVNVLKTKVEALQGQAEESQAEKDVMQAELDSKDAEFQILSDNFGALSTGLTTFQNEGESLRNTIEVLQSRFQEVKRELTMTQSHRDEILSEGRVNLATIEELQAALVLSDADSALLRSDLAGLSADKHRVELSRDIANTRLITLEESLDASKRNANQITTDLQERYAELNTHLERTKLRVDCLSNDLAELHSQHEGLVFANATLTSKLEVSNKELANSADGLKVSAEALEKVEEQLVAARSTEDHLRLGLAAAAVAIQDTESALSGALAQNISLQESLEKSASERYALEFGHALMFIRLSQRECIIQECNGRLEIQTLAFDEKLKEEEALINALHKKTSDHAALLDTLSKQEEEIARLSSRKDEVESMLALTQEEGGSLHSQLDAATVDLRAKEEEVEQLKSVKDDLEQKLNSASSSIAELRSRVSTVETERGELYARLETAETRTHSLETARSIALFRLNQLEVGGESNREILRVAMAEVQVKSQECTTLEGKLEELKDKHGAHLLTVAERETTIGGESERLLKREQDLHEQLRSMSTEKEHLLLTRDNLERLVSEAKDEVRLLQKELTSEVAKSTALSDSMRIREEELDQQRTLAKSLVQDISVGQSKLDMQASEISSLEADRGALKSRELHIQSRVDELETALEEKENKLVNVYLRMEEMDKEMAGSSDAVEEAITARDQISVLEKCVSVLEDEKTSLAEKLSIAESESSSRADGLIQAHDLVESSNALAVQLKKDLLDLEEALSSKDTMLVQAYDALEADKSAAALRMDTLSQEIEDLKSSLTNFKINETEIDVPTLGREINELKDLLHSSDKCVEELRTLQEKTKHELGMANERVQDLEERVERKDAELERILASSSSNPELGKVGDTSLELLRLEQALSSERDARCKIEEQYKARIEEEKRCLIKDAEEAMQSLRSEKKKLETDAERTESEAYAARQLAEELRDEIKQHIDKSIQTESRVAALENENSRLKRSAARFQDDKSTEASALQTELKRAKLDIASARDTQHALESRLAVYEERLGHKENELQHVLQNMKQLDVPGLEKEIQELRTALDSANNHLHVAAEKDTEVAQLTVQIEEMSALIKIKDDRIQRLESVKLTKEKIEALKKLKKERSEALKENEKLRTNLRVAEQTLAALSSSSDSQGHNAETTKLKFDKEALENKLRKFATHCQRLEEERNSVRNTLRSRKVNGTDTSSIADLVVTILDRVTSLEEECDSLSRSESQASSFLVEIENLRQFNRSLQTQASEARQKLDQNSRMEVELKDQIRQLRKQVEATQYEANGVQSSASGVERKLTRRIQHLEQENLQIMQDLKAKKAEVHHHKAELTGLRTRVPAGSSHNAKLPPASPAVSKENNHNRATDSKPPRGSSTSTRKTRRRTPGLGEALAPSEENTQECKTS